MGLPQNFVSLKEKRIRCVHRKHCPLTRNGFRVNTKRSPREENIKNFFAEAENRLGACLFTVKDMNSMNESNVVSDYQKENKMEMKKVRGLHDENEALILAWIRSQRNGGSVVR